MTELGQALHGVTRLGFDTVALIYFVERDPNRVDKVRNAIQRMDAGQFLGACSIIALTEVLVLPLRFGNQQLAHQYRNLLFNSTNFPDPSS